MLRYSYQVELRRHEARKAGIELDLLKNPTNHRAKEALKKINKEIDWFKERIKTGNDPGCRNL